MVVFRGARYEVRGARIDCTLALVAFRWPCGGHFAGLRVPPLCPSVRTLRDVGTFFCARDDGCCAFALLHSAECVRARAPLRFDCKGTKNN